jgi:hypothetical protein
VASATDERARSGDKGGVTKGMAAMIDRRSSASSAALVQVLAALLALASAAAGSTAAVAAGWYEAGIRSA